MFLQAPLVTAVLILITAIAAFTDIRSRRIPNWLVATGLLLGFGLNVFLFGMPGLKNASLGFGLSLLIYLPLFFLRGMGAGDVKLMAAIGAMTGPENWLRIFILTAILGGVIALGLVIYRGVLGRSLLNVVHIIQSSLRGTAPYSEKPELDVGSGKGLSLPHGAVIALGTYVFLLLSWN